VVLVAAMALAACGGSASRATPHRSRTAAHSAGAPAGAPTSTTAGPAVPRVATAPWALPAPVAREGLVVDGNQIVVLGGLDGSRTTTARVVRVDLRTGAPGAAEHLALAVHDIAAATVRGAPLVFGGGSSTERAEVQNAAGAVVGRLPSARSDAVAVTAGGRTLVVGGYDGSRWRADVLATTDGAQFTAVATLPVPVRYAAVVALDDGRVLVIGGDVAGGGETDVVQVVDAAAGTARVVAHLPRPMAHASAVAVRGRIFVFGGRVAGSSTAAVSELDPNTGALTTVGALAAPTTDGAAVAAGDRAYFVGGEDPAPTTRVTMLEMT
jgi:hypothetical protein